MNSRILQFALALIIYTTSMSSVIADEWYEGGTLSNKDNIAWLDATDGNKLASAADSVAVFFNEKLLVPRIQNHISYQDIDSFKPYAQELVDCIDEGSQTSAVVRYTEMAIVCVASMGWLGGS